MTVLAALDRVFGIPAVRRRNLRWWPILTLVVLAAGYTLSVRWEWGWQLSLAGPLLFMLAYGSSFYFRYLGPRLYQGIGAPLDEREQMLRARAGHLSGTIITIIAVGGCFYFALAQMFHWWAPTQIYDWTLLGMSLQAASFIFPTLAASWMQAPVAE